MILVTFGVLFGVLGSCWLLAGCKGCLGWPGWLARGIPGSRQCAQVRVKRFLPGPTVNYQTVSPHTLNHLTVYPHTINICIYLYIQTIQVTFRLYTLSVPSQPGGPQGGRRILNLHLRPERLKTSCRARAGDLRGGL